MKPVAVPQLEAMIDAGCCDPRCSHEHHDKLYLVQRCHPKKGVNVLCEDSTLRLRCYVCGLPVFSVALSQHRLPPNLTERCHPQEPLDASYQKGSGQVTLSCHECDRPVAVLTVALIMPL